MFVRWFVVDCAKEEGDEIKEKEEKGVDEKKLKGRITRK